MTTRAKFKCVKKSSAGEMGWNLGFHAVTSGSEENDQFFKYTPAGELELSIVSDEVADMFEAGKEYYLDITPVDLEAVKADEEE